MNAEVQEEFYKLTYYTLSHPDTVYFIHQHAVDAFTAQQADGQTKPVAITFALAGLYLFIVKGYTGRQVQMAHMKMARHKQPWPTFALANLRGDITVSDVVAALPGDERDTMIRKWCESVWAAYRDSHSKVEALLKQVPGL